MSKKINPDLTNEQKVVLFEDGTEMAGTSELNYERLELLGDAIIRLVITHYLYSQYDQANEGSLSREIQTIISKDTLADISLRLGLVNYVEAKNIRLNDDNLRVSISTDLFESMIGAIYLDSDYDTTKVIVINLLQKHLEFKEIIGLKDSTLPTIIKL